MSAVLCTAQNVAGKVGASIGHAANRLLPPRQRERVLRSLRDFSERNPKFASFLAVQTALAGLPILLFLAFAVATLVLSLVTCILLGAITALVFTLLTTGLALLFVVPVVCIGSCTACVVFLWGLVGYLVLHRINGSETPVQPGPKVGNTLNGMTGGRLCDLADRADSHSHREGLAADSFGYGNVSIGRQSGRGDHDTRGSSPRRRNHGQAHQSNHSREAGAGSQEGEARNAQIGTRDIRQGDRKNSESTLDICDPAVESVIDWMTEFQREGITA